MAKSVLVWLATRAPSEKVFSAFPATGYTMMNQRSNLLSKNLASVLFLNRNYYLLNTKKKEMKLRSIFVP